ncbi:MAG: chorismate-binding protein [Candidatus Methanomethylicia archaeon]|jgi:hypothetical protein
MAKCPKCGEEVAKPSKTWMLKKVKVGLYKCSKGHVFRAKAP